jgi:hypothetical protein
MYLKQTLVVLMFAGVFSACDKNSIKEKDLPSVVKNGFKTKFSQAVDSEWEKRNDHYEVEFEIERKDHSALINEAGVITMIKYDIAATELPQSIDSLLKEQYKNFRLDEIEKIEKGAQIYYQVELDGKKDEHLVFSAEGQKANEFAYWN